jgi:hypothetical protein
MLPAVFGHWARVGGHMLDLRLRERCIGDDELQELSQRLRCIVNDLRPLSETDPNYSERMRTAQQELLAISLQLRRFN